MESLCSQREVAHSWFLTVQQGDNKCYLGPVRDKPLSEDLKLYGALVQKSMADLRVTIISWRQGKMEGEVSHSNRRQSRPQCSGAF